MKKLIGAVAAAALFAFGCAHSQNDDEAAGTGGSGNEDSVQTDGMYDENAEEARGDNVPPSGTSGAVIEGEQSNWDTETSEPNLTAGEESTNPGEEDTAIGGSGQEGQAAESEVIDEGPADPGATGGSGESEMTGEPATDEQPLDGSAAPDQQ